MIKRNFMNGKLTAREQSDLPKELQEVAAVVTSSSPLALAHC